MKTYLLYVSIVLAAGLTFVNFYNSLVDVRSWGANIPASIVTARSYFRMVDPSVFFRFFSPLNQLVALVSLILFWKTSPSIRLTLAAALLLYISADVLTFAFFYPRNAILFNSASTDGANLQKLWGEWSRMNWVRTGIVLAGLVLSMISLHRSYRAG